MKKVQCPNIVKGENVHKHYCVCCEGNQHIPFAKALQYELHGLLVLTDDGSGNASDCEMFKRIDDFIEYYKNKHNYRGTITYERVSVGEPISTLNACIRTLIFKEK